MSSNILKSSPPTCCPPVPTCMSTGECEYKEIYVAFFIDIIFLTNNQLF